jgi:N-acetylmuramoyl-L-alanine amidase CwlA
MGKYNVPKSHIIRHFDVTGKKCPVYWVDDARWKSEFWDKIQEGEDDMTKEEVIKIIEEYEAAKEKKSVDSWAKSAWDKAKKKGILDGTKPKSPVTREQIAAVLDRLNLL